MIDVTLFDELKKYLTKEFMDLSRQKDEMLCEKVSLEVEQQQEDYPLFENKDALRIKRLFSPLDDDVFEEELTPLKNEKTLQKLQNIENNLQAMEDSMENIKKYLCFVQMLENDSQKESEQKIIENAEPKEDVNSGEDLKKNEEEKPAAFENTEKDVWKKITVSPKIQTMLQEATDLLEAQYPDTEILLDIEHDDRLTDETVNDYIIQILTDTIRTSIETIKTDTVIIEGKIEQEKLWLSLQMLLEHHIIDQCSYQYEITLKNK